MTVVTGTIEKSTSGFTDIQDITGEVASLVEESGVRSGTATVFVPGSTGGITTVEYEPGLKKDLPEALEKIAPVGPEYHHDATWGDGNGFSHVRAAFIGPSLTVPFNDGNLTLGTWQQIVFLDFDNKARRRRIVVQIMGE